MPLTSLPRPQEPITTEGQHIERTWYMALIQLISNVSNAVIGPASATDGQIALFSGPTGKILKAATGTGYVRTDAGVYSTPTHAATSVLGRASGTSGDMADITATVDNTVLARQGGALVWANAASVGGGAQLHGLQRVLGDGATTTFDLLDIAEYLEHVGVGGSFRDPATFSLSAERTQIVFAAAPTAGDVIAIEYVTATT